MKRIFAMMSMVLVFALMTAPLSAFAEVDALQITGDGKLTEVTMDNFVLTVNEEQPIRIGASLNGAAGADENRFYFVGDMQGDDGAGNPRAVAKFEAAVEDEVLTLSMDGMTSNYTITLEQLRQIVDQQMQVQGAGMPFDREDLERMITSYIQLIRQAASMDRTQTQMTTQQMLDVIGFTGEIAREEAQVLGDTMTLNKAHFVLGPEELDKLMLAVFEKMPAMGSYWTNYMKLMADVMGRGDIKIEFDAGKPFSSLYGSMDIDFAIDCTAWYDEGDQNMRVEMVEKMSAMEGEQTINMELPFVIESKKSATDTRMVMTMDADMSGIEQGAGMTMEMDYTVANDGNSGDIAVDMTMTQGAKPVTVSMGGRFQQDADQDNRALAMYMNTAAGEDNLMFTMDVNGTGVLDRGEAVKNQLLFSLSATKDDEHIFRGTLGFDVTTAQRQMPEGGLLNNGKPAVDITKLTEDGLKTLQGEATTVAIIGYGTMMQTSGVAKLMSDAIESVTSAAREMYSQSEIAVEPVEESAEEPAAVQPAG